MFYPFSLLLFPETPLLPEDEHPFIQQKRSSKIRI